MTAILEQLQGLVAAAEIPAGTLGVALILGLFGLMVVGLVLGQELAFVLGGAGVIVGWLAWGTPGVTIAMTKIYDQMQSYSMVAIPMFVLMANFLTHSKVADGLFESIRYLLGPLKGGLGLAVILVSTVFAATTGIVGASVVTMGMLSLPVLLRSGYKPSLACGMVCAGGSLGILIPPSIMLVSMGSYAEVSVGKIFFAAIVPGLSLSLGYIIYLMVVCHIHPDWGPAMSPEELAEMPLKKRITGSLINLIPPLILIFGVLGSIFGGIATPTEAAGIGALFSLILGVILVVMRISPISSLRAVAGAYVELFKNLPLTIIMVFMVLGAYAQLKLSFSDTFTTNFFWLAVTGLSLYTAAFVCESLRSGINTVPIGQAEAARALGLGFMQSATEIILPQAFRGSVAPLGNTLIALLKNSTVAAAASVATETSSLMSEMIEFRPDVIIQIFLIFALGYVILIIPIGMLTTYLSNKLAVRR